jgi:hypothetical protein
MKNSWRRSSLILLLLIAFCISSCTPLPLEPKASVYYVTPVVTYLKECPAYDCKAVGDLYKTDQVEQLEVKDGWWRVQAKRTGQIGWLPRELLSPMPVPVEYYYVAADSLELRECPSLDCPFRKILFKGDRVQKIAENDQSWLRVLVEKDASIGWIPASLLTDRAEKPIAKPVEKKSYLYAAGANVNLYSLPLFSSKIVKTVLLNGKLEKLAQHGQNWFKVRHLKSGAEGWAAARDLKTSPVAQAPLKKKRRFRRKAAPPKPPLEPEAM